MYDNFLKHFLKKQKTFKGFVWFYGISIIVDYLMPNLVYSYILNI